MLGYEFVTFLLARSDSAESVNADHVSFGETFWLFYDN